MNNETDKILEGNSYIEGYLTHTYPKRIVLSTKDEFIALTQHRLPEGYSDSEYKRLWRDIYNEPDKLIIKVRVEFYLPKLVAVWKASDVNIEIRDIYEHIYKAFPKVSDFEIEYWTMGVMGYFDNEKEYLAGYIRVDAPYRH